jgi:hypothetical protein
MKATTIFEIAGMTALIFGGYLFISLLPDIKRYLEMKTM